MTNNDEMVLKLKATAEKAKEAGDALVMPFDTRISTLKEFQLAGCPANILALLAEREADKAENAQLRQRIAELEQSEHQLIGERDAAEQALADMYQAATGEHPEWSNWFGFADAVDAVEQRLGELEARTVSVKLPETSVGEACDFVSHVEVVSLNDLRNLCDRAGINLEVGE